MIRAAAFALVGAAFLAHWTITAPSFQESESQDDWSHVLGFSGALFTLALALPAYARLVGGRRVFRVSLVPAAGAALGSVVNVFEDGLHMDWLFLVFVANTWFALLGMLALTVVIATAGRGRRRLLALVPTGTMLAIVLYVFAGGPLMLATWLAAAAIALLLPKPSEAHAAPGTL